jgi:hypothetical protein
MQFIIGIILGIVISTIGFSGLAHIADSGVDKVKQVAKESSK